jgi:DNA-binding transcriptional LysR family regulator
MRAASSSRDVDIETLRLLVAVAERGSLNAAAHERGVSQPAASARIRAFEARWRIAALRRSRRGSRLTPDGEVAVAWAREVLSAADRMRGALQDLGSARIGTVDVAASLTVAEHLLPGWLSQLHACEPDIRPVLTMVNSETVAALVRAGRAELGFVETVEVPDDLEVATIGVDTLIVVVAPSHPWARRRAPLSRSELQRAEWVLREPGSGTRATFQRALGADPTVALEATSTTALIGVATAGVGPAVVSAASVPRELDDKRLVAVPTVLDLRRPLSCVWQPDKRLAPAATALLHIAQRTTQ